MEDGLPRLERIVGMQRASLLVLTGYNLDADGAWKWGLVTRVGQSEGGNGKVKKNFLMVAVEITRGFAAVSPGSLIVTTAGLTASW